MRHRNGVNSSGDENQKLKRDGNMQNTYHKKGCLTSITFGTNHLYMIMNSDIYKRLAPHITRLMYINIS